MRAGTCPFDECVLTAFSPMPLGPTSFQTRDVIRLLITVFKRERGSSRGPWTRETLTPGAIYSHERSEGDGQ